jgi:hypothetical protein
MEKKLSLNIYNKLIYSFKFLRNFSYNLNYNYFHYKNFTKLKEISFNQDIFMQWHMNINHITKFFNIHQDDFFNNYFIKNYFIENNIKKDKKIIFDKIKPYYQKYLETDEQEIPYYILNKYKKKDNVKNLIFFQTTIKQNFELAYNIKTKFFYLNKNLILPKIFMVSQEKEKEDEVEEKFKNIKKFKKKSKKKLKLKKFIKKKKTNYKTNINW